MTALDPRSTRHAALIAGATALAFWLDHRFLPLS